ncbi:MAG: hypothetical protein WC715_05350 [Patescibacteria group bacterium]|jgi:hypothetical protein
MIGQGTPDKIIRQTEAGMEAIGGLQEQVKEAVKETGHDEEIAERLNDAFTWLAGEGMIDPYTKLDEALAPNIMAMAAKENDTERLA